MPSYSFEHYLILNAFELLFLYWEFDVISVFCTSDNLFPVFFILTLIIILYFKTILKYLFLYEWYIWRLRALITQICIRCCSYLFDINKEWDILKNGFTVLSIKWRMLTLLNCLQLGLWLIFCENPKLILKMCAWSTLIHFVLNLFMIGV